MKLATLLLCAISLTACTNSDWFKLRMPDGPCVYPTTDGGVFMSHENTERWIARFCEFYVHIGTGLFSANLEIEQTDAVDVEGLQCLCGIEGTLRIGGNPHLETLDGMEGLVELGSLVLGETSYWSEENTFFVKPEPNPLLSDIGALGQIEVIDFGIVAYAAEARLPSQLAGLDTTGVIQLKDVSGAAPIELPPNLQTVNGIIIEGAQDASELSLPPLLSELGYIDLINTHGLTELEVPSSVSYLGFLGVIGGSHLRRVSLPATTGPMSLSLHQVPLLSDLTVRARALGSVTIQDAPSLVTTGGMSTAERLTDLVIHDAVQLQDLAGLGGSREDGVRTELVDLPRLGSTSPLRMPARSGGTVLSNLPVLSDLTAFEGVVAVADSLEPGLTPLTLDRLSELQDLTALRSLEWVSGPLVLRDCERLESLHGLDGLRNIGGLTIESNESLRDVSALMGLVSVAGDVLIVENPALLRPQLDALVDHLRTVSTGAISVRDNGP
jgi:hypothetical protein